tara:strand:- start:983 stop:1087 length:105 start_codon:yes stop_codon:yes gene_type:complete
MKAKALKFWNGLNKKGKIIVLVVVAAVIAGIIWS